MLEPLDLAPRLIMALEIHMGKDLKRDDSFVCKDFTFIIAKGSMFICEWFEMKDDGGE